MPRNSDFRAERFDDLLAWLNPDRNLAIAAYLNLRHALTRIFAWNRCADPEGMTDEVVDRVVRQIDYLRDTYEGNPKLFFYAVANNLIKEYQKKVKPHVSIEDIELAVDPPQELDEEIPDVREECLRTCLRKLSKEKRELIVSYYSKEKQAKIIHRAEMARQLGVSIEALRVRMRRIRGDLQECIERCLDQLAEKHETK